MLKDPLVSIVTPVYNAAPYIEHMVKSVQSQTYENWELILVDDMSKDDSVKLIKRMQEDDARIHLIRLKENSGAAIARNAGLNRASGQFLSFLDADDLWLPPKLEVQVRFMQENNHKFTFTGYEFADSNGVGNGKVVHVPLIISYREALKNHIISTITTMIDLDQVPKEYVTMPNIRRGQDAATWWQILRNMGSAYGIDSALSLYRRTDSSLSANKFKAVKRTWYLLRSVEKLNFLQAGYCFFWYAFNAVRKRV